MSLAKPKYSIKYDGTYSRIEKLELVASDQKCDDYEYFATFGAAKKCLIKYFSMYISDFKYSLKNTRALKKENLK